MPLKHSAILYEREGENGKDSLAPRRGPETIAALSHGRARGEDDVTDFLELIRKKNYLLTGVDLSSAPPLPGGVRGDRILSSEQAEELRREFDTDNLPSHAQYSLFQKLTELEVLTASDVKRTQYSVAPGSKDPLGCLTGFEDVAKAPESNPKERLGRMIRNERFAFRHVLCRYGQRCRAVDKLAGSHLKVLNALRRI